MSECPFAITTYLDKILYPKRAFAYLQLDGRHCVIASGGDLEKCGVPPLVPDFPIENQFDLLSGILPVDGIPVVIQSIELSDDIFIDMHVFKHEDIQWVLLLDNTAAKPILHSEKQQRLSEEFRQESTKKINRK